MNAPERESEANGALYRLRDRTDELELIISSLTLFALVSLPGWLNEFFGNYYTHWSVASVIVGVSGLTLAAGLCYVLAGCFVVHLLTRAYWVGLIGLRYVFPDGIDWSRTPGMGPIAREYFRERLPDLQSSIDRADRIASSLFSVISLLTLSMLWVGTLLVATLSVVGQIGARFGMANLGIAIATTGMVVILIGPWSLLWLLDRGLATRWSGLQQRPLFRGLVRGLARVSSVVLAQRWILPIQLTLQSNTRPLLFGLALGVGAFAMVVIGSFRLAGWQDFTLWGDFDYLRDDQVRAGLHSAHYEDQRTRKDRFRPWPLIPAFELERAFVPLFLPYQPLRDDPLLKRTCPPDERSGPEPVCMRRLWSVTVGGVEVPMDDFIASERGDLRMRGLTGVIALHHLDPGLHELRVRWNPGLVSSDELSDDRYADFNREYRIPFLFAPAVEWSLPDPAAMTPSTIRKVH